jgi:YbbR domain-containing protein
MRYHPFRYLGLKFLSIGLAVLLWLAVAREPIVERTLRVPLQFQNVPENMEIVGEPLAAVDVLVRGSSSLVSQLQPGEVAAVVDLQAARPGSRLFHLMPSQVRAPFGLEVQHVAPSTIAVEFEITTRRQVPVVPAIEGEPAPGYVVGTITSEPAQVEVIGPRGSIQTVTEATTEPVSVGGATTTVRDQVTVGVANSEVRLSETQTATVTVAVTPAPIEQTFERVPVRLRNVQTGLRAAAQPSVVDVSARGTRELLTRVKVDSVTAFVDLAGLGPGQYNLPVRVESTESVGISRVDPALIAVRIR